MKYRKKLCGTCNLDGVCNCQTTNKKMLNCGMEEAEAYNRKYQQDLKEGLYVPED